MYLYEMLVDHQDESCLIRTLICGYFLSHYILYCIRLCVCVCVCDRLARRVQVSNINSTINDFEFIPIEFSLQCAVFDNRKKSVVDTCTVGSADHAAFIHKALGVCVCVIYCYCYCGD